LHPHTAPHAVGKPVERRGRKATGLRASITAAINAKKVSAGGYATLMAAWNAMRTDRAGACPK